MWHGHQRARRAAAPECKALAYCTGGMRCIPALGPSKMASGCAPHPCLGPNSHAPPTALVVGSAAAEGWVGPMRSDAHGRAHACSCTGRRAGLSNAWCLQLCVQESTACELGRCALPQHPLTAQSSCKVSSITAGSRTALYRRGSLYAQDDLRTCAECACLGCGGEKGEAERPGGRRGLVHSDGVSQRECMGRRHRTGTLLYCASGICWLTPT